MEGAGVSDGKNDDSILEEASVTLMRVAFVFERAVSCDAVNTDFLSKMCEPGDFHGQALCDSSVQC